MRDVPGSRRAGQGFMKIHEGFKGFHLGSGLRVAGVRGLGLCGLRV